MFRASSVVLAATALLAACGGGGGNAGGKATPKDFVNAAIGGWRGTTAQGDDLTIAVLESGEVWGLMQDAGVAVGVIHAPTSSTTGSAFQADQPRAYLFGTSPFASGTLTGTVNASTLSGTAPGSNGSIGFNLARMAGYNIQASLPALAGVWNGSSGSLSGVAAISNVSINAAGSVLVVDGACTITGAFQTRPGTAVYDVTLNYRVAAGCTSDLTLRGIAVLSNAGNDLTVGLIRPDRNDAGLVLLRKSGT